jgi:hypothetical protein
MIVSAPTTVNVHLVIVQLVEHASQLAHRVKD